ncbi:MAG: response regulator [Bacteroidia bacterium]|nr:response regulator [Bacteroidia bacterium]
MKLKNQINIFIVEDNQLFLLTLKADIENTFVNMPIRIYSFATGEECMERFNEKNPQIVILDYHLNTKNPLASDGIQVLDLIIKENPDTKVLILTGDDNVDIALNSFKHGASDYIVKTDTQFRKVIYSLFNFFNLIEAKNETRKYKFIAIILFACLALLIGGLIVLGV